MNTVRLVACLSLFLLAGSAHAQSSPAPVAAQAGPAAQPGPTAEPTSETAATSRLLTLEQALRAGHEHQPLLRQARATLDVSEARRGQARAPLLPQVTATAAYRRATGNFAPQPGVTPTNFTPPAPNSTTYDFFNFGLNATQLVYDFGQSWKRMDAAAALVDARRDDQQAAEIQVAQNVRVSFFNARAAKALVAVAQETLLNFERHLQQIEGFVRIGTRAEIDLAQARADRANAVVGVINADNAYASAKALLNQAMGIDRDTEYEVSDDNLGAVEGEDDSLEPLVRRALKARPEFVSFERQVRSQELTLSSIKGGYWPSIGIGTGLTEAGRQLSNMTWNWNATATVTWQIFQGGLTNAQVDEARASLASLYAQIDILRQQVRVDVEQARLSVRANKAVIVSADEVVTNARERLRLAEGRYAAGVGNAIELADAQLSLTSALAQRVQADYNLAAARAQLLHALGLP